MRYPFNGTYRVNAPFGMSAAYGPTFHQGIDYNTPTGTQLYAAVSGKVVFAGNQPTTAGWAVSIAGEGYVVKCFHMLAGTLSVTVGQTVTAGQPIGKSNNSGNSTGAHLHFQVEKNGVPVDPAPLLTQGGGTPPVADILINDGDHEILAYETGLTKQNIKDLGATGKTWKGFWSGFIPFQQIYIDHGAPAQVTDLRKEFYNYCDDVCDALGIPKSTNPKTAVDAINKLKDGGVTPTDLKPGIYKVS